MTPIKSEETANHSKRTEIPKGQRNGETRKNKLLRQPNLSRDRKEQLAPPEDRPAISEQRTKKFENSDESPVTGKVASVEETGVLVTDGDKNGRPSQRTRQHKPKVTDELKI